MPHRVIEPMRFGEIFKQIVIKLVFLPPFVQRQHDQKFFFRQNFIAAAKNFPRRVIEPSAAQDVTIFLAAKLPNSARRLDRRP